MREQDTTYVSKLIWKKNQNLTIYCFFSLLLQDTNYFYRQITTTRKLLPLLNFYHKRTYPLDDGNISVFKLCYKFVLQ